MRPADLPKFSSIGPRIRWWRERRGMTRMQLAKRVGLAGYSSIASLENDEYQSTKVGLHKFAAALKVSLRYLETDEGDPEDMTDTPAQEDWPLSIPRERLESLTRIERSHLEAAINRALAEIEEDRERLKRAG